jgi:LPS-assembly lipoprotein
MKKFFVSASAQGASEDRPRCSSATRAGSGSRGALHTIITSICSSVRSLPWRAGAQRTRGVGVRPTARGRAIKLAAALTTLCVVSGCGFEPLHGRAQRAERASQIESVQIETDSTRPGQMLKAEIEDQINPEALRAEKLFLMSIRVAEVEVSLFINVDGTSSRGDMQYNSTYTLTRKADGKLIDRGKISRVSSYNISENADYATYVAREDARRRGVLELAQDYKLRLANLVGTLNNPNAASVPITEEAPAPIIRPQDTHENRTTRF